MKAISKTFNFSGGKTLKVRADGRYEWCGKLLGRDECVILDYTALRRDNEFAFARHFRELANDADGVFGLEVKCVVEFVRRHWYWVKGS